jgi:tRNA G26 N,N-dimethylase Trm1
MRVSREMIRNIIQETCGEAPPMEDTHTQIPIETVPESMPITETESPVGDLMVEMEVATRALEQVVESVQNAAHLCPGCGGTVAAQAPVMEAMVAQAEALQEMLDAQHMVVTESVTNETEIAVVEF